jgi:V8-like Glu-specific endopeptidase
LATVGMLAASTALVWAGSATAAPGRGHAASADARNAHQRIVDYWTPARRASAIPRDVTRPTERKGKPGGGGGGTTGSVTGATWTRSAAAVAKTTGKVYFTMGGSNYVCSGSAVDGQANLVLTAGHCVWDDVDKFATKWLFWPGYNNGIDPTYGEWTAKSLFTTAGWKTDGGNDWRNDAGLAVVTNGAGASLKGTMGSLPTMKTGTDYTNLATAVYSAFGYPAAQKYKGQTLTYCQGPVQTGYDGDANTLSMACDMTGGSSGGPWYDEREGTGSIVSLNSYGYSGSSRMYGPTFDAAESSMLAAAGDGACDSGDVCAPVTPSP